MVCLLYVGQDRDLSLWQERTSLHAKWLGLDIVINKWNIKPNTDILFVTLGRSTSFPPQPTFAQASLKNGILFTQSGGKWSSKPFFGKDKISNSTRKLRSGQMSITISEDGRILHLWCGLLTVGQMYYRREKQSVVISDDVRLLMPRNNSNLDSVALYSLFHFGAVSAPFTLFRNIKRVPPGHILTLSEDQVSYRLLPHSLADPNQCFPSSQSPEDMIQDVLISQIDTMPQNTSLFFSGGIDSGILAALGKHRGRFDVRLINCDFSTTYPTRFPDPEAQLARSMAKNLGLKLDVFGFDISAVPRMLQRIGRDYSFPFGDSSVIPTNLLAHFAADVMESGTTILDGTGADGIFYRASSWTKLNGMYKIPWFIRKNLSLLFQHESIFNGSTWLSRYLAMIHQSLYIPPLQAEVISQSRLAGIGFLAEPDTVRKVQNAYVEYLQVHFQGLEHRMQAALLDLIHVCAGIYAAKDYDPLRFRGLVPYYPFLSEEIVEMGFCLMRASGEMEETKHVLKALLSKYVPYGMVYRPKSGFKPPIEVIFRNSQVREYINDLVLCPNNPVRDFIFPDTVDKIFTRLFSGRPIYKNHFNFLWSYTFVSIWLYHQTHAYSDPTSTSC